MNIKNKKYLRRGVCIVMMFVLLCGHGNVYAALLDGGEDGIGSNVNFSDLFSACEIAPYRDGKECDEYTHPTKEGYVFAGWYTNATYKTPISPDTKTGKYFPKFVDESVLSLGLQLTKDTTYDSEMTVLRLITSVDTLKYASVGFLVEETPLVSSTVYQTIKGYTKNGENSYVPSDVFHSSSSYFATCTLNAENVIANHGTGDDFGATATVVPQWKTLDGTTVTGQGASFEINDFLYDTELEGEIHFWGTLPENLNRTSACTEDVQIKLLKDATVQADSSYAASISAGKDVTVTVKGNGKTITTGGASDVFSVEASEGEITWQDVTIEHKGSASLFDLNGDCDLTLKKVTITGTAANAGNEAAIIRTGEHCNTAHVVETIEQGKRDIADEVKEEYKNNYGTELTVTETDTSFITTETLLANEQDKTVYINMSDCSIDTSGTSGIAGIRVMRGTIAHLNIADSAIDTKDTLPVYVTGVDTSDDAYKTWRGMAYITADSESIFSQAGKAVTVDELKANNKGMVALQEYTNRVILLADTHYMPEEDEEGDYYFNDIIQGISLGHTQADRMKNILLDIGGFHNKQKVDSVLVLGDISTDNYPKNKIGINDDGTFSDITANYVSKFKNDVMSVFQSQLGIDSSWALPGNHDTYRNEQWNEIMGYDRQYALEIGNAVFVMLDTYVPENDDTRNTADYSYVDVAWLEKQLADNPSWIGKPIFLCTHYYRNSDTHPDNEKVLANEKEVQDLLNEYQELGYKFVSMFYGHVHSTTNSLKRHVDAEDKIPIIISGGYAFDSNDGDLFGEKCAWGFGVLEWNDSEAHYYHVKYDRTYVNSTDGLTDNTVSYKGAIEKEIFLTY